MARNAGDIYIVGNCESCGCLIRRDAWEGRWIFGSEYAGADPECEHSHPDLVDMDDGWAFPAINGSPK